MKCDPLSIGRKIIEEGFGRADLDVIDQYISKNFVEWHVSGNNGKAGLKKTINQRHAGLSNFQFKLQRSVQDDDIIRTHYTANAIQSGKFMDMPTSGKEISIDIMGIFRFELELLVEHWGIPDHYAAMMQIGVFNKKDSVS